MRSFPIGLSVFFIAFLGAELSQAAEPVRFAREPVATRDGERVKIEFAVDRETDVAVYVLDAKGKVVRHLAAGVIGKKAPKPLTANSLSQSIEWDGKDDIGRAFAGTGCRASVRIGLAPKFDRLLAWEEAPVSGVRALAVGPAGELFVWRGTDHLHGGSGSTTCSVFDRSGTYLRTVLPYPANLPAEMLRGLRRVKLLDGRTVPFMFQGETRSFYPGLGQLSRQRPMITRDGRVVTVGHQEVSRTSLRYQRTGIGHLVVTRTDGSVPEPCVGPRLMDGFVSPYGSISLAPSPDGKTIYAAGLRQGAYREPFFHAVYRCGWEEKSFKAFIGSEKTAGSGPKTLNRPYSMDTDREGNIYVADNGNDRIAVFKPDGAPLAQARVNRPAWVDVHRKTGAMYVMTGALADEIVKLDGYKNGKEVSRLKLRSRDPRMRLWPVMALDDSAEPAVIWVGGPFRHKLVRIEDKGNTFGEPRTIEARGSLRGPRPRHLRRPGPRRSLPVRTDWAGPRRGPDREAPGAASPQTGPRRGGRRRQGRPDLCVLQGERWIAAAIRP